MLKRVPTYITLMFFGVVTTSCDQKELEEVTLANTAVVENGESTSILVEETFEGSAPLSTFDGEEFGTSHAFKLATNPVFAGKKAARIELRDSDPKESGGTRAEMVAIKDLMQKEMWFSFAVYLPAAEFKADSGKEIITQWHQVGGTNPPSYLVIQNDTWSFEVTNKKSSRTKGHVKYDLGTVTKDVWHQFTFHYILSNGSNGLIEVWHNGKKAFTHQGGNMYPGSHLPKWKVGIYKWDWNGSNKTDVKKRVLYFDNIRVGTAKATLALMTAERVLMPIAASSQPDSAQIF
jgi:hypothetical protein